MVKESPRCYAENSMPTPTKTSMTTEILSNLTNLNDLNQKVSSELIWKLKAILLKTYNEPCCEPMPTPEDFNSAMYVEVSRMRRNHETLCEILEHLNQITN